jgi:plastocyanin
MKNNSHQIQLVSSRSAELGMANTATIVIGLIALVVVVAVGFVIYRRPPEQPAITADETTSATEMAIPTLEQGAPILTSPKTMPLLQPDTSIDTLTAETAPIASSVPAAVQEFIVSGQNYSFTPNEIRVKQGDTVRISFKSLDGMHDWRLDEFNASTQITKTGENDTVEFVADRTGRFQFYCSVGQHRQLGMVGTLIVE